MSTTEIVTKVVPVLATVETTLTNGFNGKEKIENPPQVQVSGRTKSGKTLKIRSYPKFENLEDERLYRKQHLAAAFRVFADRGFDEGVAGHISVRDPILTDHFCTFPTPYHSPFSLNSQYTAQG